MMAEHTHTELLASHAALLEAPKLLLQGLDEAVIDNVPHDFAARMEAVRAAIQQAEEARS
jgi:hypothetical protein